MKVLEILLLFAAISSVAIAASNSSFFSKIFQLMQNEKLAGLFSVNLTAGFQKNETKSSSSPMLTNDQLLRMFSCNAGAELRKNVTNSSTTLTNGELLQMFSCHSTTNIPAEKSSPATGLNFLWKTANMFVNGKMDPILLHFSNETTLNDSNDTVVVNQMSDNSSEPVLPASGGFFKAFKTIQDTAKMVKKGEVMSLLSSLLSSSSKDDLNVFEMEIGKNGSIVMQNQSSSSDGIETMIASLEGLAEEEVISNLDIPTEGSNSTDLLSSDVSTEGNFTNIDLPLTEELISITGNPIESNNTDVRLRSETIGVPFEDEVLPTSDVSTESNITIIDLLTNTDDGALDEEVISTTLSPFQIEFRQLMSGLRTRTFSGRIQDMFLTGDRPGSVDCIYSEPHYPVDRRWSNFDVLRRTADLVTSGELNALYPTVERLSQVRAAKSSTRSALIVGSQNGAMFVVPQETTAKKDEDSYVFKLVKSETIFALQIQ